MHLTWLDFHHALCKTLLKVKRFNGYQCWELVVVSYWSEDRAMIPPVMGTMQTQAGTCPTLKRSKTKSFNTSSTYSMIIILHIHPAVKLFYSQLFDQVNERRLEQLALYCLAFLHGVNHAHKMVHSNIFQFILCYYSWWSFPMDDSIDCFLPSNDNKNKAARMIPNQMLKAQSQHDLIPWFLCDDTWV